MTYVTYKRLLLIFLILFIVIIYFNSFVIKSALLSVNPAIRDAFDYAFPVLSLVLLYFGSYAYVQKVKTARKLENPIAITICASVFTFMSFAYPVWNYYFLRNMNNVLQETLSYQIYADNVRLDPSVEESQRLFSVTRYYVITGKCIEYLDSNLTKVVYSPDEANKKEHKEYEQMRLYFRKAFVFAKAKVHILMTYAVISGIVFLLLLKHKKSSESPFRREGDIV